MLEHKLEKPYFHPDNIPFIFYESHLHIQADVFVEVSGRIVFFGPIGMAHLENPLKPAAYHNLFVELRTLS